MRAWSTVPLGLFLFSFLAGAHAQAGSEALARAERKLGQVQSNGARARPSPAPTEFTEAEINAYCASGGVELPAGVQSVSFHEEPGLVRGTAIVDFDQLKSGRNSSSPLLAIFSGVHQVAGVAQAHGAGSQGFVHVDSVTLDGVEIPRFALQVFVEKYLQPTYGNVGLDSRFPLPDRIDTITVGLRKVTLTQK
jgi:hypothetical protein